MFSSRMSRRTFAGGTLSAIGLGLASNDIWAQSATPDADSPLSEELPSGGVEPDGSWAFTDDRGTTISLPGTPTKVVAFVGYAAALYDLGFEVVGYYGGATDADGTPAAIAGNLPIDRIPSVALADNDYSVDVEKLIDLETELFIGPNYSIAADPAVIWPLDADIMAQVALVTEVIHIAGGDGADVERTIETIANLAIALGVDPSAESLVASRDDFTAARDNLATAIASRPNLTTLWMSGSASGFWVSTTSSDILFLRKLGLQTVGDEVSLVAEQSWETFGTLTADLIFNDDRTSYWYSPEQLSEEIPSYPLHPAVAAGQVMPWRNTFVPSYAAFTPIMEEYTPIIAGADEDVVSQD